MLILSFFMAAAVVIGVIAAVPMLDLLAIGGGILALCTGVLVALGMVAIL
jgi:hypothetical protein